MNLTPASARAIQLAAHSRRDSRVRHVCDEGDNQPAILVWVAIGNIREVALWFCAECAGQAEADATGAPGDIPGLEVDPAASATCRFDGSLVTVEADNVHALA